MTIVLPPIVCRTGGYSCYCPLLTLIWCPAACNSTNIGSSLGKFQTIIFLANSKQLYSWHIIYLNIDTLLTSPPPPGMKKDYPECLVAPMCLHKIASESGRGEILCVSVLLESKYQVNTETVRGVVCMSPLCCRSSRVCVYNRYRPASAKWPWGSIVWAMWYHHCGDLPCDDGAVGDNAWSAMLSVLASTCPPHVF